MNAEIIAVGSELLLGQIVNSNAQYLSEQMTILGINVYHHTVVGDNPKRLGEVLHVAKKRSNVIIMTGGLGPTKDDLTKETTAAFTGKKLVYDQDTMDRIEGFFQARNRVMTENNRKQALILENSHVFPNDHGLACGMGLKDDDRLFIMLPGPPKELNPMFEKYVIPYLRKQMQHAISIQSRVLRFFDIGESQLVEIIDDLLESQSNPTIAPLASDGEVTLRLTIRGLDETENENELNKLQDEIVSRLDKYFYGTGEVTLVEKLVDELKAKNTTISSAESLTGGLFASELTKQPGVSSIFPGSIICYSNEVKKSQLQVSEEALIHGTVSHECAKEMARNVRQIMGSDIGISFTGVAGPDQLEGKEPGLLYIGISTEDETKSYELKLAGSRQNIRDRSVKYGAYLLLQMKRWMNK
ncbi:MULTISPECIES: competence/damage-inducible protein A [Bacillaceae]|uniref:Putative competence-damage inducible protein n=1 Tax=Evansella alkalicola TaxID=745819 RepID=A0ABS6JVR3_9BACI|nr:MULTISPECIES: competence/damage-inducible protein A [Bacillaceae]MBU9722675.1 competence/damage-inducible protein A [Bacillus alkalicola]